MAASASQAEPSLPIPIYRVSHQVERYMLYDSNAFLWLRRNHSILGVLIGTLPQAPQQNVFLGLPVELLPEEARLLVENHIAFVVDDLESHVAGLAARSNEDNQQLRASLHREGLQIAKTVEKEKEKRSREALSKYAVSASIGQVEQDESPAEDGGEGSAPPDSLFGNEPQTGAGKAASRTQDRHPWSITPAASSSMLTRRRGDSPSSVPCVDPASYALFKHLHQRGYFMTPGLRFGCQFSVYPGDPLRFHSHFLAMSAAWDEEFDLLHLIGGGRLGTGVKKAFMIGGAGEQRPENAPEINEAETQGGNKPHVRTFCIEWVAM